MRRGAQAVAVVATVLLLWQTFRMLSPGAFGIGSGSDKGAGSARVHPCGVGASLNHPPIAVITFNRPDRLADSLQQLICEAGAWPERVTVFSDADSKADVDASQKVCDQYGVPLRSRVDIAKPESTRSRITQHYSYIMRTLVLSQRAKHIVILEDDLIVSRDFVEYMEQAAAIMDKDRSIVCASAWNDVRFLAICVF